MQRSTPLLSPVYSLLLFFSPLSLPLLPSMDLSSENRETRECPRCCSPHPLLALSLVPRLSLGGCLSMTPARSLLSWRNAASPFPFPAPAPFAALREVRCSPPSSTLQHATCLSRQGSKQKAPLRPLTHIQTLRIPSNLTPFQTTVLSSIDFSIRKRTRRFLLFLSRELIALPRHPHAIIADLSIPP